MYKGDNKTALASQKMISDALFKLLKYKSFSSISISELCKEAQISRQTFYTLFKSKENIILYEFENKHSFVIDIFANAEKITLKDLCHYYSLYINNNFDFIKSIIDNGLSNTLFEDFYNSLLSCKRIASEQYEYDKEYFAVFVAGALTSIAKIYVTNGQQESSDTIEKRTYSLFIGNFFYN